MASYDYTAEITWICHKCGDVGLPVKCKCGQTTANKRPYVPCINCGNLAYKYGKNGRIPSGLCGDCYRLPEFHRGGGYSADNTQSPTNTAGHMLQLMKRL